MNENESKKPKVLTPKEQAAFEFIEPVKYEAEYVGETPDGFGLFRRKEGHGGYAYYTDEIPPALCVFDEGLTNMIGTFAALDHLGQGKAMWEHIGKVFGYTK